MGFSIGEIVVVVVVGAEKKDMNDKQEICLQHHPFDVVLKISNVI